jgi:predicted transposase/invertase (TIGR01784 family)
MERKLISFDWAIKKILRSKANFGILEGFLSELLFTDIYILEILESEGNQDLEDNKNNRVDIKVKDAAGRIILIEVQYSRELDYLHRILFAASKAVSEHLPRGAAYADVSKIISVNILYFDFGNGDDYIYHGTTRFIGLHKQTELQLSEKQKELYKTDTVAGIYPEYYLIELRNFDDIAKDTLDEWIYFLKNEHIEDSFSAKGLAQAKQILDVLKMSPSERHAYELHQKQLHHEASLYQSTYVLGQLEGRKQGRAEGREEGRAEGRQEGVRQIAKNMKTAGMATQTIAQITGLPSAHIEEL